MTFKVSKHRGTTVNIDLVHFMMLKYLCFTEFPYKTFTTLQTSFSL